MTEEKLRITGQGSMASKTSHPLYNVWYDMCRRCTNKDRHNYKYYGARGIKVCDRWLSFDNFVTDMGSRPDGFELDRIDNDKGYDAANCRWISHRGNMLNKRAYNALGVKGVYLSHGRYQAAIRRFGKLMYLGSFADIETAKNAVNRAIS